jgi:hypothetical protein
LTINSTATAGSLTITNPTGADRLLISGNNRTRIFYVKDGAGFVVNGVTITNGNAAGTLNTQDNGYGGGIMLAFLNAGGVFTLTNSIIRNNTAQFGGGIYRSGTSSNLGSTTIANSTISNNSAQEGGGISNSFRMTVTNSTVSNNTAGVGGGIYNYFGTLTMTNSTVSSNSASSNGGGVNNRNGSIILRDLTISKNTTSAQGGGIYNFSLQGFSSIANSIIAVNTAVNGQPDIYKASNFASNGNNLIGNSSTSGTIVWLPSDILDQQASLAPLGNYGGGTQTHALLSSSPAINAGNRSTLLDQRGLAQNGASDIGAFELQANENFISRNSFDFDGDGRADISVFRASNRNWYLNRSSQGFAAVQWGIATDKITPADYDGDGKTDVAVWRDESANADRANFYIFNSSTSTVKIEQFGRTGDQPLIIGDWDSDGKDDPAVYRNGQPGQQSYFYYRPSSQPLTNFVTVYWGTSGDMPVRGDFDGDGKMDATVFRPSNNTWYIRQSSDSQIRYENWGLATDKFVPADYDGDGKTDLAVFRNGTWYIRNSSNNQNRYVNFGISTDVPVPADYDGDGKSDLAVFRDGNWYLLQSTSGFAAQQFGMSNDKPIPAAFIP